MLLGVPVCLPYPVALSEAADVRLVLLLKGGGGRLGVSGGLSSLLLNCKLRLLILVYEAETELVIVVYHD